MLDEATTAALIDRIARRVVELLDERGPVNPRMVDAGELAQILGVSRSTVYDHAGAWGALKVGGALRFDWPEVKERLRKVKPKPKVAAAKRGPGRPRREYKPTGAPLLPIRGQVLPPPHEEG